MEDRGGLGRTGSIGCDSGRLRCCWVPICFAVGELLSRTGWRPAVLLLLAIGLMVGLCWAALRWGLRAVLVPVAGLWVLTGWWCAQVRPAPDPQMALLGYADNLSREVRGRVVRVRPLPARANPDDADSDGWRGEQDEQAQAVGALQIDVRVDSVEYLTPDVSQMVPMTGGVRATVIADDGKLPEIGCGDVVEAPMRMREPERYHDPGAWQYADYLLSQGMSVHASVHAAKLRVPGHEAGTMACRVQAAQAWASGRVLRYARSRANRMLPRAMRLDGG